MKKIFSICFVAAAALMISCNGSATKKAEEAAKATADSIAKVDSIAKATFTADSLAQAQKAAFIADSVAKAEAAKAPVKK